MLARLCAIGLVVLFASPFTARFSVSRRPGKVTATDGRMPVSPAGADVTVGHMSALSVPRILRADSQRLLSLTARGHDPTSASRAARMTPFAGWALSARDLQQEVAALRV